ncbi:unnamed protein product [Prunus brigantina]
MKLGTDETGQLGFEVPRLSKKRPGLARLERPNLLDLAIEKVEAYEMWPGVWAKSCGWILFVVDAQIFTTRQMKSKEMRLEYLVSLKIGHKGVWSPLALVYI